MSIVTATSRRTNRAVSPVIGVILMVAITVILAAVIGTFVLGLSPDEHQGPTATISIDGDAGEHNVTLSHDGGESIDLNDTTVLVDGTVANQSIETTLAAGERVVVRELTHTGEATVTLRHDPSGEVIAERTVTIE